MWLSLLLTISIFEFGFCGYEESEDHPFESHITEVWNHVGAYLILLTEDPRISGNPSPIGTNLSGNTDPVKDVSILILQLMIEFLQNHGTEIYSYYNSRRINSRLQPEEFKLFRASAGFSIDKLYHIHDRYREAVAKVEKLVRDFFEKTPKDAPKKFTPQQAIQKLSAEILTALLRM